MAALAAGVLLAATATAAEGAVHRSVYTVTQVTQSSTLQADVGDYSWSNGATLRYAADPGRNLVRFDFPAAPGSDPFVRGGSDPGSGVLHAAAGVTQIGGVVQDGVSCGFVPTVPPDEAGFRVEFLRLASRPRAVLVQVMDQDALRRLGLEEGSGRLRAAGCGRMPPLVPSGRASTARYDRRTTFVVARARLRRAAGASPVRLVLRGVVRSRVIADQGVAGTLTVSTTLRMRLISSR